MRRVPAPRPSATNRRTPPAWELRLHDETEAPRAGARGLAGPGSAAVRRRQTPLRLVRDRSALCRLSRHRVGGARAGGRAVVRDAVSRGGAGRLELVDDLAQ